MATPLKPLNGEKTHPLSDHAIDKLRLLKKKPIVRFLINPGVCNRLEREGLAETVFLPDPGRGKRSTQFLRITEAGIARLKELAP